MGLYGLWIPLPEDVRARFREIIDRYSETLSTPRFEPHITLFGMLEYDESELLSIVDRTTREIEPLKISLSDVSISNTFHQAVFARVVTTPELLSAQKKLSDSVKRENNVGFYMPHISLVYGDVDFENRWSIANEITLPVNSFVADSICVVSDNTPYPESHLADYILEKRIS